MRGMDEEVRPFVIKQRREIRERSCQRQSKIAREDEQRADDGRQ